MPPHHPGALSGRRAAESSLSGPEPSLLFSQPSESLIDIPQNLGAVTQGRVSWT